MIQAILTMDDVPSKNTPAIAAYLREKGIQAVLFAVGREVERDFGRAVCALKQGMILGNHSYSHPAFSELSLAECVAEIETCDQVLDRLYQAADVERRVRPFRFPYGDKGGKNKAALQQYLKHHGFHKMRDSRMPWPWWRECGLDRDADTFWTYDFQEYLVRPGSAYTKENAIEKMHDPKPAVGAPLLVENGRHILLMHAHDETEAVWPDYARVLIDHALENGVTFENPEFIRG